MLVTLLNNYLYSLDTDIHDPLTISDNDIVISPSNGKIVDGNQTQLNYAYIVRNIDDKDNTEIYFGVGSNGKYSVRHSNGTVNKHKHFSKIIKAVNDMRNKNH